MDDRRRDYEYDRRDYDRSRDDYDYRQEERRKSSKKSDRKRSRQRRRYSDNASRRGEDYRNQEAEYYRRRSRSLTRNHRSSYRRSSYRSDRRRSRSRSRSRDDRRRRYRRSRSYDDDVHYQSRRHGRSYSGDRHDDGRRRRRDRRRSRSESPPSRRRRRYDDDDRRSRSRSRDRHGGDRQHRDYHHQDQQHHQNHHHHHYHQPQAVVSDYSSGGEYAPEMPAAPSAAAAAPSASASASAWSTVQQEVSRRSSRSQSRSHSRSRRSSRKQKKSRKERRRRRRGSDRRSRSRSSTNRSRSRSRSSYNDRKRSSRRTSRKQRSDRKKKKKDRRPKYSSSPSSPSSAGDDSSDRDDTVGHFEGGPGTMVADRYRIVKDVGLGTFGRVVECIDTKPCGHVDPVTGQRTDRVAIKLVRNIKRYYDSALIEADIVQDVNRRGGRGLTLNSIMYDRFALPTEHYCLVFECLGPSLYDFIKKHDYRPFPLYCVRDFAQQLLEALEFLHSFQLIHTDLKLENILLCTSEEIQYRDDYDGSMQMVPASTRIKIIDFGGATYDNEKKSSTICTRQYRPPEVILGLHPWSMPADLWSAGCIIAELYIGELLFGTHDNAEHLALIERAIGPFPRDMVSQATANGDVFDFRGLHRGRDVLSSSSYDHVRNMESIEAVVCDHDRHSGLIELLHALLVIDPNRRATAAEALSDPVDGMFFK